MTPPSIKELNATLYEYNFLTILQGSPLGCLYKAVSREDNTDVLIAIVARDSDGEKWLGKAGAVHDVRHEALLPVYDCGKAGEYIYAIIKYPDGETLASLMGKGPCPMRSALRYIVGAVAPLELARRRYILPRHLHPENIFVTPADTLSFSLVDMPELPDFHYTLAPELRNHPEDEPTAASVIYTLGSLLATLILGKPYPDPTDPEDLPADFVETYPELAQLLEHATADAPEVRISSLSELASKLMALNLPDEVYEPRKQSRMAKHAPAPGNRLLSAAAAGNAPEAPVLRAGSDAGSSVPSYRSPMERELERRKVKDNTTFYLAPVLVLLLLFGAAAVIAKFSDKSPASKKEAAVAAAPKTERGADTATHPHPAPVEPSHEDDTPAPTATDTDDVSGSPFDTHTPDDDDTTTPSEPKRPDTPAEPSATDEDGNANLPPPAIPSGMVNWLASGSEGLLLKQSSTLAPAASYGPEIAVNNNSADDGAVSVALPADGKPAWWSATFKAEAVKLVSRVVIYGGGDRSKAGKLTKFSVELTLADGRKISKNFLAEGYALEGWEMWSLPKPVAVRSIRITSLTKKGIIVLREVEAYGPPQ